MTSQPVARNENLLLIQAIVSSKKVIELREFRAMSFAMLFVSYQIRQGV